MTKLFLTFFFVLLFTLPLFAQSVDTAWVARYNGPGNGSDADYALAVDASGNVYVTGYTGSGTSNDYATIKYAPNGDTLWVRTYNGPGNDADGAYALAVDDSGNVYVTGGSYGSGTWADYATLKYNSYGDTLWVRRYYNPYANYSDVAIALAVGQTGNVYVTGSSYLGTSDYDYLTIMYNSNGSIMWGAKYYNGPGNSSDAATALAVDDSGNVYVTGYSMSDTSFDYATLKYNSHLGRLWVSRYNGPGNDIDIASALAVDDSGNVYVTGYSIGSGSSYDYATIKYLPNGDTAWVRRYNGPGNSFDVARALAVDDPGNVYVTGRSAASETSDDYATIKYNSAGDTLWVRRYNGPGNSIDGAFALAVDDSGNVYVTGYSIGSGSSYDYATIKYLANGDTAWVRRYNGPGNNEDRPTALAVDGSGNVYVTGYSIGSGSSYDYATVKYVQFLRGNANGIGKVDIADIVYLVSYLFKHGPAPAPIQSGDANCDAGHKVDIADIVYLVAYLFKHGPVPCI